MTPAPNHLFELNDSCKELNTNEADFSITIFLCTDVKALDEDDYKKLSRTRKDLRHTQAMPLTLESSDMSFIKCG